MEGENIPPNTVSGYLPDSAMDFDFIDELFLEGCWLGATDGSEFLHHSPSTSGALFDPSLLWHTSEANNGVLSTSSLQSASQEERQRSALLENQSISEFLGENPTKTQLHSQNMSNVAGYLSRSENYMVEGSELSRRWWIGPRANPGPSSSVMERLIRAIGYIKESARDRDVLIQIWLPVYTGGRRVLTTNGQPFSLDLNCPRLASYRDISVNYQFSAEKDSKEMVGLPGRVFMGKVPEWTPDVRFFRSNEFPRVGHAQKFDIRGTLAVPVFEQGSRNCLGVIEVAMTIEKIKYHPELESICKALEAFDLRSSEVSNTQKVKACNGSYQAALPEILEVLRSACGTHQLPLAQTWVPCIQQCKVGHRHSDENYVFCVSTVDSACYVANPCIQGFHEACSEHHLLKGQGVAGKAFTTNQPCFSPDITSFSKTEYPLSHHARMFGLHAAVAIRLRSIDTYTADFVLEFFLPMDCKDPEEQKKMLTSLSLIIQKFCYSLRVVTDKELEEETVLPSSQVKFASDGRSSTKPTPTPTPQHFHSERSSQVASSWNASHMEVQGSVKVDHLFGKEERREVLIKESSEYRQSEHDSSLRASIAFGGDYSTPDEGGFSSIGKRGRKRSTKVGESINLQMLQQYFAGNLKDAAKSIGVCPTTLKRICREQGIQRWPSRKIKKVGHSLQKLQHVINTVQRASGAFQIESFYSNFPELASPNLSGNHPFSNSKPSGQTQSLNMLPESGNFTPQAAASKSPSPSPSCSQSSSSSQCCSSGTRQHAYTSELAVSEDRIVEKKSGNVLKGVRSCAELHNSIEGGPKLLPRRQSQISLSEHPKSESLLPLQKNSGGKSQETDFHRVKVTYGEEKIRFRIQNDWGHKDLLQEIARRFNIDDTSGCHLKYLDDESEWVLLTCDTDLEECIDLCQSSQGHTIKLSLQVSQQLSGSSLGSNGLL
ncbi:protein NLP4-like [Cornus florida]|uniref:protein NLP4-like n=1 Tax=Cornus florida TaxID=4283 RepID=UPI0028998088|nr:protein NLP4-like [Cornus florida]XP_059634535.1 protein NLP4-like [Cornus florida]